LFNENSITTAFRRAAFHVASVRHVFQGQYLWVEAQPAADAPTTAPRLIAEGPTMVAALAYGQTLQARVRVWTDHLAALRERGGLALWGAGAKGVTFANLCDSRARLLDCVIDVNPNKQGRFLAGTGHPIMGPHELPRHGLAAVLVLNPNYLAEVRANLEAHGHSYPVVNLMDWNEHTPSGKTNSQSSAA
jgi:hypothetical protein